LDSAGLSADSVLFPWICRFLLLGFSWNLSSESKLFKGLRALSGEKKILFALLRRLIKLFRDVKISRAAAHSKGGRSQSGVSMALILVELLIFCKNASQVFVATNRIRF
jgi:hypothetical protein